MDTYCIQFHCTINTVCGRHILYIVHMLYICVLAHLRHRRQSESRGRASRSSEPLGFSHTRLAKPRWSLEVLRAPRVLIHSPCETTILDTRHVCCTLCIPYIASIMYLTYMIYYIWYIYLYNLHILHVPNMLHGLATQYIP